jgi:hypothetical protein
MVLIVSQDLAGKNLTAVQENPIEEDKESLSYHGASFMRSNMVKEKDMYDFTATSDTTRNDLITMRQTLAQSKNSAFAERQTISSSTNFT